MIILYGNVLTSEESAKLSLIKDKILLTKDPNPDVAWLVKLLERFSDEINKLKNPYNDNTNNPNRQL